LTSPLSPAPAPTCQMPTRSWLCGYGRGMISTPFTTLKMALLAPMPSASITSARIVSAGARPSRRKTYFRAFSECDDTYNPSYFAKKGSIAEFAGRPRVVRYFCVAAGISGHVLERERIAGGSIIQSRKNRPMDRNNGYDASDPFDQVAIYTVFMCQSCLAIYNPHTNENDLLPYHVVGQGARGAGWLAEPFMGNWRVLCPSCSKLRATQK